MFATCFAFSTTSKAFFDIQENSYLLYKDAYNSSSLKDKQILLVTYEDFLSRPSYVVDQMKQFLDTDSFSNMDEVLAREGCPRKLSLEHGS